jgi:hypothetical protein
MDFLGDQRALALADGGGADVLAAIVRVMKISGSGLQDR